VVHRWWKITNREKLVKMGKKWDKWIQKNLKKEKDIIGKTISYIILKPVLLIQELSSLIDLRKTKGI
jgi:hypothetical protein